MKKMMAILASILLLATMLPISVFAYENETNLEQVTGAANSTRFEKLGAGFNALSDDDVADVNLGYAIFDYDNVVADLLSTSSIYSESKYATSAQELMLDFGISYNMNTDISVPIKAATVGFGTKFGISANLKYSNVTESMYYYYNQEMITNRLSLYLPESKMDDPSSIISDDFLYALDKLNQNLTSENVAAFYDKWGTHILVAYNKGASLEYVASSHLTETDASIDAKLTTALSESVGIGKVSLEAVQEFSVNIGVEYAEQKFNLNHKWYSCGGDSSLLGVKDAGDKSLDIAAWQASVDHSAAVMIPQSTQWKAIWEFVPAEYADVSAALQFYYRAEAVGVNAAFFESFTTYRAVNTTDYFYVSPVKDAAGNNLMFKMPVEDEAEVAPGSKINVVNMGGDLSAVTFEVSPAAYGTVDACGMLTISPDAKVGSKITVVAKNKNTDEVLPNHIIHSRTYIVATEGTPYGHFAGGYGTQERPYLIATAEQLSNIRHYETADHYAAESAQPYHYLLIGDIDLTDFAMSPISALYGVLDGNGHTVSGYRYSSAEWGYYGLVRHNYGTIKNVHITDFALTLERHWSTRMYAGFVAGENVGTIYNVHVTDSTLFAKGGNLESTGEDHKGAQLYVGGICGTNGEFSKELDDWACVQKSGVAHCTIQGHAYSDNHDEDSISCVGGVSGYASPYSLLEDVYSYDNTVEAIAEASHYWDWFQNKGPIAYARVGGIVGSSVGESGKASVITRVLAHSNSFGDSHSVCLYDWEDLKTGAICANKKDYTTITGDYKALDHIRNLVEFEKNGWYEEALDEGDFIVRIARDNALSINDAYLDCDYFVGEPLNLTNLQIAVLCEGSTMPVERTACGFTVSGYDPNVVGEQTITVTCGKVLGTDEVLQGTYTVTVREPKAVSLSILTPPEQGFIYEGDDIDYTGLTVAALLENGETKAVALSDLSFAVADDPEGNKMVTVTYCDVSVELVIQVYPSVALPTVTYGDLNGDGAINNRDLALLQQHINKWDVQIDLSAADVNGDGAINNRDLALLQQYINKWDVQLGKQ